MQDDCVIDTILFFMLWLSLDQQGEDVMEDKLLHLHTLLTFAAKLKGVPRTGWNDQKLGREVPGAESVADHSFGLIMFAWIVPEIVKSVELNVSRLMALCKVHDLAEAETGDINLYAVPEEERPALKKWKYEEEEKAMRRMCAKIGKFGIKIFALWVEYEAGETPEARIARELDKIEAAFQAIYYYEEGYRSDPRQFFATARSYVRTPELIRYLDERLRPLLPQG